MNIIIVGCSRVGLTLASELVNEDNNITMIDLSQEKVSEVTSKYDVMGIVGNGATHKTLSEAGVETADLLIAVTDSDELNLLCCIIAKKTGNCRAIARVVSPEYSTEANYLKKGLGLEMIINPELEAAKEIVRVLRFPSALNIETFAGGRVELITFRLPEGSVLSGMQLKDAVMKLKTNVLISTVQRDGEAYIPNGSFVFQDKDIISLVASHKDASDFFLKINYNAEAVRDAIILGAGDITNYLCNMLTSSVSLKVIEKDYELCEQLSNNYRDVTVINGDANEHDILVEEGILNTGAFLSLLDGDEENILLSLFAKKSGTAKVVTKINRTDYDDIINHLDLDTTVYPKSITSDMILRYVRATKSSYGSNVETMYNVIKGKVEASEFKIGDGSPICNTPLMQLNFKKDVLVAAILRDGKLIIPRGSDVIMPNDSVIIVTKILGLRDISDILDD